MRKLLALPLLCASAAFAQTTVSVPSIPLSTFQQGLGSDTHINYNDGEYNNIDNVIADLQYMGITTARDPLPNSATDPADTTQHRYQAAAAGIKFDLLSNCNESLSEQQAGWDAQEQAYPGSIIAIEGTNEINNAPCPAYDGQPAGSQAAAIAFQRDLYAAVHSDPLMKGVPVLDFTGGENETGSLAGQADVLNTHPYPQPGQQPYARVVSDVDSIYGSNVGKYPAWITEDGYQNFYYDPNLSGMDQLSVAEFGGNLIMDAFLEGMSRVYLYQELQAYPNNQTNGDTAYGLFDYFNQPTDTAIFLHNIHQVLQPDTASPARGTVAVTLSGGIPTMAHLLAMTTSSSYSACASCVIVWGWNEQPEFNTATDENEPVTPLEGYIQLKGYAAVGLVFPGYPVLQQLAQAGTENGSPYYNVALFGFPTAVMFKPVAAAASTQTDAARLTLHRSVHVLSPVSRVEAPEARPEAVKAAAPSAGRVLLQPNIHEALRLTGGVR